VLFFLRLYKLPMSSHVDSYALPAAVRRIARSLRISGWVSFWAQVVLSVISLLVLFFSSMIFQGDGRSAGQPIDNPGSGIGFAFALLGNLVLLGGAYSAFRYTRLARQLESADPRSRPKPGMVIQALVMGLTVNLVGMFITILGGEALIGALFAKALSQPQSGAAFYERITQAIQPIDILIVQANTNTILAHFIGILASLWLVRVMSRQ
jgi:amino acid transporter